MMKSNQLYLMICSKGRPSIAGRYAGIMTPIKYIIGAVLRVTEYRKGELSAIYNSPAMTELSAVMKADNEYLATVVDMLTDVAEDRRFSVEGESRLFRDIVDAFGEEPDAVGVYFACLAVCREFLEDAYDYARKELSSCFTFKGKKQPIKDYSYFVDNEDAALPADAEQFAESRRKGEKKTEQPAEAEEDAAESIVIDDQDVSDFLDDIFGKHKASQASDEEADSEADEAETEEKASGSTDTSDLDAMFKAFAEEKSGKAQSSEKKTQSEQGKTGKESEFDQFLKTFEEYSASKTGKTEKKKKKNKIGKSGLSELVNKVKSAQNELLKVIFGQDAAVNTFIGGYFNAEFNRLTEAKNKQPLGVFLFAGPPGVGKTFLAEKSAEVLGLPFRRFDMSEYSDKEANFEFSGSDKVYKNGSEGNVTGFVSKNPNAIVLFDEIEKAHLNIIHLFLQILDAGRLRDNYTDEEVSFSNCIIIFTTNAGKQLYEDDTVGTLSSLSKKTIAKALAADTNPVTGAPLFPAAIISRLAANDIVMMDKMSAHNLERIAKDRILSVAEHFTSNTGVKIKVDDRIYSAVMFAEGGAADARTVKGKAKNFLVKELYELFRLADDSHVDIAGVNEINFSVQLPEKGAIRDLFVNDEAPAVLVFAEEDVAENFKASGVEVFATTDPTYAAEILKSRSISLVMVDITVGMCSYSERIMNIEDVRGVAYDFMRYVIGSFETPCYLIQNPSKRIGDDEMLTFTGEGVRGAIEVPENSKEFKKTVVAECEKLHRQKSMLALAKSNRVLSFDTRQLVSNDGSKITVQLYDFNLSLSLDVEDNGHILTGARKPTTTFDDVVGAEEAKSELKYFVEYLKNPEKFMGAGVKAPRGVLLYGPPGTGKTMLAKAMAGESDVTFINAEGNEFLKRYVGEGPAAVHELFRSARKYAPAILFIDEIDAIGVSRESESSQGSAATLTSFLTEMDGFRTDPKKPVFVLAATNYSLDENATRSLDSALLRRFDRRILIDLPNADEREKYLRLSLKRHPIVKISEEEIRSISKRSVSMSLADLESVVELAMRDCIKSKAAYVDDHAFDEAFESYRSGDKKKWDEETVLRTARHEAGHALISLLAGECPSYLTVVSRGNFGGYMQKDGADKFGYTKSELLTEIRIALGGRAAELVCYGPENGVSTGPSGDLRQATSLAKSLVGVYGMDEEFGLAVMDREDYKDKAAREKINAILRTELDEAVKLIKEHRDALDRMVHELLLKNHMTADEIKAVL